MTPLSDEELEKDPRDNLPKFIPEDLRVIFRKDKHGISFPTTTGIQLRLIRNGVNYGRFYSYTQFGGVRETIELAMARCLELREEYPINAVRAKVGNKDASVPINGVGFRQKFDRRRLEYEHFYWASYKRDGRPAIKTFSLGYTAYSEALKLHALKTAAYFRSTWESFGSDMDMTIFKKWKTVRLYETGTPACYFPRPRRMRGETVEQHARRMDRMERDKNRAAPTIAAKAECLAESID